MILYYEIDKKIEIDGNSLIDKNLSNKNLHRLDLESFDAENVNFENTNLRSSFFKNINFKNANFKNSNLCGVDGRNNIYINANFTNALIYSAGLENSNFTNANFTNAKLAGSSFKNSNLTNVNFKNADLTNVNFENANLTNVKGVKMLEKVEKLTLKKEIKKLLQHNLSELNFERIINNDNEYSIFIEKIINYILNNEYDKLKELLSQNMIDNQKNIEKYTKYLFDLFFSIQNDNIKYIENREQKSIFWIYDSVLHQYNSLYNIRAIQKYKENLIIFFNIKKSDNASLGVVLDLEGRELFSIPFPTKEDSECINDDIIFYGSSIDLEKSTLEIVFTNGTCWLEFWCRYDLENMKYISSGLRK